MCLAQRRARAKKTEFGELYIFNRLSYENSSLSFACHYPNNFALVCVSDRSWRAIRVAEDGLGHTICSSDRVVTPPCHCDSR